MHVAFEDAAAYAAWASKELPTEAEWEFAAQGGLDGALFCWGNELNPGGYYMANTWQKQFPWRWTVSQVARRSGRSRPTVTVFVTWPAMFGSGPPTGIPIVIRPRLKALVACRAIRGEVQKIAATIQRSLRSEFLAR